MTELRVVQCGLGPLGQQVVRSLMSRRHMRLVGAVDPAPDKVGRDVGALSGLSPLGVTVVSDLESVPAGVDADVALLTTLSQLSRLEPQVVAAAGRGWHVVSTCEELAYPWQTQADIAGRLDRSCRERGVACVGTGVNPGFLMDYLPAVLSGVCLEVEAVRVTRVQDAAPRRVPFQQKIGAGLTLEAFAGRRREGTLRHVGLLQSMHFLAAALGWHLDRTEETLEPVIAAVAVTSGYCPIDPGQARGVEQVARGYCGEQERIRLHFRAAVGEPEPHDTIEIVGQPSLRSTIAGGVNGDAATCAVTLNAARAVLAAAPGLRTMLDLPMPRGFGNR